MAAGIRIVLLLALAAGSSNASAVPTVPVIELGRGGMELPAARRRAVEQAILAAADAAGVVVCRDGTALSQPESAALDRACAEPGLPRLWWEAEVETEKSGDVFLLDVLLKVAIGGPLAESPLAIVPPHVLLPGTPAGIEGEESEDAVLDGIDRSLLAAAELRSWLAGLKERPELLRATPGPGRSRPASAEEQSAWERELALIADLLIDGRYLDGRDRAARLLREDLPPEVASRARELRAKAEMKLVQAGKPAGRSTRSPGTPGERGQIEIRPARPKPPERQRWERGFDVRVAKDDRGLTGGLDGRLTVSEEGVAFTRRGASRPDWSIAWADLAAAHRAEGIWDVPYPLALAEKGGRLHHLVRIDAAGKPLSGGAILSALAEGRLRSRKGYE